MKRNSRNFLTGLRSAVSAPVQLSGFDRFQSALFVDHFRNCGHSIDARVVKPVGLRVFCRRVHAVSLLVSRTPSDVSSVQQNQLQRTLQLLQSAFPPGLPQRRQSPTPATQLPHECLQRLLKSVQTPFSSTFQNVVPSQAPTGLRVSYIERPRAPGTSWSLPASSNAVSVSTPSSQPTFMNNVFAACAVRNSFSTHTQHHSSNIPQPVQTAPFKLSKGRCSLLHCTNCCCKFSVEWCTCLQHG